MSGSNLALQENECTGLWDDMPSKLGKQKIHHMNIALVNLRMIRLDMSLVGLSADLSGAEDIGEKLHDDSLGWRYNVLGSGQTSANPLHMSLLHLL